MALFLAVMTGTEIKWRAASYISKFRTFASLIYLAGDTRILGKAPKLCPGVDQAVHDLIGLS
jgi:hypothetical protein